MPAQTLAQLREQVRMARIELAELKQQITATQGVLDNDHIRQLLCANEQLLLAALSAEQSAKSAKMKLKALALSSQRDDLTNTPTRAILLDRLERTIALAQRRCAHCAVVFLDIDHFKQINDRLGHAAGDAVLKLLAQRLALAVRDSDAVGRYGGDEFLILLTEVSKVSDVSRIVREMLTAVAAPAMVAGHVLQVSMSAGVAIYPDDAKDASNLIALADAAMYRSKRRGGGSYTFHGKKNPTVVPTKQHA